MPMRRAFRGVFGRACPCLGVGAVPVGASHHCGPTPWLRLKFVRFAPELPNPPRVPGSCGRMATGEDFADDECAG